MKISGRVVEGSKIGRTLGYPTANIAVDENLDLADGVYAATVCLNGKDYGAMANLGIKPTFSDGGKDGNAHTRTLELHLFDFSDDLYGRTLTAELKKFVRPEQKFASLEALRTQISQDEIQIKQTLKCI